MMTSFTWRESRSRMPRFPDDGRTYPPEAASKAICGLSVKEPNSPFKVKLRDLLQHVPCYTDTSTCFQLHVHTGVFEPLLKILVLISKH